MTVYTVKEHLILEKGAECRRPQALLKARLLSLAMVLMPRGNVRCCRLALRADGKLYAFAGALGTPQYYELVRALSQAESLEFLGFYEYAWESWWEQSRGADPYVLSRQFLRQAPGSGVFYSLYVGDDRDPGEIAAYGRKNGRLYRGVVPYVTLEQLPGRGQWYVPITAVSCRAGELRNLDSHRLMGTCSRLRAMGGEEAMKISGQGFRFSLRKLEIRSPREAEAYLALCGELRQITGGNCSAWEEFVDLSGPDPRMLVLEDCPEGLPRIRMTAL